MSKRGWKAKLTAALAAATIAAPLGVAAIAPLGPAVQAYADEAQGQWVESGSGSWYRNADGSYPSGCWKEIGGLWYHFDPAGWVQTGWFKDTDGSWYYLREEKDSADYHAGCMCTYYAFVDGKLYYFDLDDGRMAQSEVISYVVRAGASEFDEEDRCDCDCFGADGAFVEGWANIPEITLQRSYNYEFVGTATVPGGWIYQTLTDPKFTYWQQIDGSWYYFQPYNYLGSESRIHPTNRMRAAQPISSWRQDGASREGRAAGTTLAHPVPCRQAGSMTAEHGIGSRDPERWRQAGRRSAAPGTASPPPEPCSTTAGQGITISARAGRCSRMQGRPTDTMSVPTAPGCLGDSLSAIKAGLRYLPGSCISSDALRHLACRRHPPERGTSVPPAGPSGRDAKPTENAALE